MFLLHAAKAYLTVQRGRELLTSGAVGTYQAKFLFGDAWNGLTKVAVFKAERRGGRNPPVSASVLLDDTGVCAIPWEPLVNAGYDLYAGVYGTRGDEIVLPTIWAKLGVVVEGTRPGDAAAPATPALSDQLVRRAEEAAQRAEEAAQAARDAADSLSGASPGAGSGGTAQPSKTRKTLSAGAWEGRNQTIDASGILEDEDAQLVLIVPTLSSQSAYLDAGILCTGQAADKLTFTAETVPEEDLSVYVVIQEVKLG